MPPVGKNIEALLGNVQDLQTAFDASSGFLFVRLTALESKSDFLIQKIDELHHVISLLRAASWTVSPTHAMSVESVPRRFPSTPRHDFYGDDHASNDSTIEESGQLKLQAMPNELSCQAELQAQENP